MDPTSVPMDMPGYPSAIELADTAISSKLVRNEKSVSP